MTDDDAFPTKGIVCWLESRPDGQVRLVIDDVERIEAGGKQLWTKKALRCGPASCICEGEKTPSGEVRLRGRSANR